MRSYCSPDPLSSCSCTRASKVYGATGSGPPLLIGVMGGMTMDWGHDTMVGKTRGDDESP